MSRTHVTPGVYTYETDLTIAVKSIGVTSAALVGETVKGPAFQPLKVSNYNEFKRYFGGLNPALLKGSNGEKYPQYELSYIAKEYLSEANSLYVTRVLGLNGYDAGKAYNIIASVVDEEDEIVSSYVIATLRSGAKYTPTGLSFDVDAITATLTSTDVYGDIGLEVEYSTSSGLSDKTFTVSLKQSSKNYIKKLFGTIPNGNNLGIYVEDCYDNILKKLVDEHGADLKLTAVQTSTTHGNFKTEYQGSQTPWFVSGEKDGICKKLFRFITISDGSNSQNEIKVSIENINLDTKTFNVIVRSFNDNDSSPVILERFSKCSMDQRTNNFIGSKIGTVDGKFMVRSKYIVVEVNENDDLQDELPLGFLGFPVKDIADAIPLNYKTQYGLTENRRKTYLGFTSSNIDYDLLKFKGLDGLDYAPGFHLDQLAETTIVEGIEFNMITPEDALSFEDEASMSGTWLQKPADRKFTVLFYGGFDGWDAHRSFRTNETNFSVNNFLTPSGYDVSLLDIQGIRQGDVAELSTTADYYAFLKGVKTFENPKETDVNVVATPGLDFDRNSGLVSEIIDIVEYNRADSVYIINSPNYESAMEVVYALEDSGIDSNYSATYFPWKQYADPENNVYVNMPVTSDVLRNIAVIDKKSQPWFSVAGLERGNVKCVKTVGKLKVEDTEALYSGRINPVETFIYDGVKIWGNKTLQVQESALSSLNIRRLLLQARKLIATASLKLVFDQNDAQIRQQFVNLVNPILENIRKERGLVAFRVEVDNSVESIERKELNARILIKPTHALEYITIEFGVTPLGVSFDDI